MDNQTFIIVDESGLDSVVACICENIDDVPLEVTVGKKKELRSAAQQGLQWQWNTDLGTHWGLTKVDAHRRMKRMFAIPIFIRDDVKYAKMILKVRKVRDGSSPDDAEAMMDMIVDLTSTTKFNIKQMTEYLYDIEHYAAEIGAHLTFPEDLMQSKEE